MSAFVDATKIQMYLFTPIQQATFTPQVDPRYQHTHFTPRFLYPRVQYLLCTPISPSIRFCAKCMKIWKEQDSERSTPTLSHFEKTPPLDRWIGSDWFRLDRRSKTSTLKWRMLRSRRRMLWLLWKHILDYKIYKSIYLYIIHVYRVVVFF